MPRKENDAYYTPDNVAQACVDMLAARGYLAHVERAVEPHVGAGAFARALGDHGIPHITGIDIDPAASGFHHVNLKIIGDFLRWKPSAEHPVQLILGNPPFSNAQAHVEHALRSVSPDGVVAFLLRLAFLESKKRAAFWDANPPRHVHVLRQRPSFTGDGGNDSAAYAWFVWNGGLAVDGLGWLDVDATEPVRFPERAQEKQW